MKRLLTACVVVLGVIFVYGFIAGDGTDRMRIVVADDRRTLNVTVTLFDVTPKYAWVTLYGCTAERAEETMQTYCSYFWERESTQTTRADQQQYPFTWRQVPGGLIMLTAVAFDVDDRVLAKQVHTFYKRY